MKDFEEKVLKKLDALQQDVRRLGVLHEETDGKIDAIIEVVSPEIEKTNKHAQQLRNHEARISALETASQ